MANTRLAPGTEVRDGNQFTSKHAAPGLWQYLDSLPEKCSPAFIRGDASFGVEPIMAEARGIDYLMKLRLTAKVKKLIRKLFAYEQWTDAGCGFTATEARLQLSGWSRNRRVVVLRRAFKGDIALVDESSSQPGFAFIETDSEIKRYEYAVLVTSLKQEIPKVAQCYRDRGDMENCFDELKNQWGCGGYTMKDLKRCRFISRMVALVYDWWSLFVRLANPVKHNEAARSKRLGVLSVRRGACDDANEVRRLNATWYDTISLRRLITSVAKHGGPGKLDKRLRQYSDDE